MTYIIYRNLCYSNSCHAEKRMFFRLMYSLMTGFPAMGVQGRLRTSSQPLFNIPDGTPTDACPDATGSLIVLPTKWQWRNHNIPHYNSFSCHDNELGKCIAIICCCYDPSQFSLTWLHPDLSLNYQKSAALLFYTGTLKIPVAGYWPLRAFAVISVLSILLLPRTIQKKASRFFLFQKSK